MARLQRVTSKVFAENATEVGQFGSLNAGTKVTTTDISTIQALPAWQNGWQAATVGENCYPTLQERNGLDKVQSYFLNYLLQEGIPEWDSGTTYYTGSIVKLINGVDVQFYKSLKDNNTAVLSDTDYWEKVQLGGASRNIGEIVTSTIPLTDAGLHLLDGTLLSYGVYKEFIDYIADLYAENPSANYFTTEAQWQQSVITYGVCGKFVYDATANTVRLPKVTGIIEGTTDVNTLSDLVEAGLPNITGAGASLSEKVVATGALQKEGKLPSQYYNDEGSLSKILQYNFSFDASRSSAIYGNSTTVQPQTIKVLYYIVIATSTKTDIQVDIDEIATDLNGKADTDLTNATDQAKILMGGMAMPSDKYINLTLGASGTAYTAPADGYFIIKGTFRFLEMSNTLCYVAESNVSTIYKGGFVPCPKGNSITIGYDIAPTSYQFRFVYAVGSESEVQ